MNRHIEYRTTLEPVVGDKTHIVTKFDTSSLEIPDLLFKACEKFYHFCAMMGFDLEDTHNFLEDVYSMISEDENDDEDEENGIPKASKSLSVPESSSLKEINSIADNEETLKNFIEQFNKGNNIFKKRVFIAYLKDTIGD